MSEIKAIETIYNGYRFRSRLEARWAVFFDTLRIKYHYEPEGYQLSNGSKYLPDFYLPDFDYYAEVKGKNNHLIEDLKKARQFVFEKKTAMIILSNIPNDKNAKGLFWFPVMYFEARYARGVNQHYAFFEPIPGKTIIQDDFYVGTHRYFDFEPYLKTALSSEQLNDNAFLEIQAISGAEMDEDDHLIKDLFELELIEEALTKARQARFEYNDIPF